MKISTRGRYALRIMLDLALSDSGRPVRVKEIAERQEISEKYMEQIISVLNKAGYVGVIDTVTLKDLAEWSRGQTRPL